MWNNCKNSSNKWEIDKKWSKGQIKLKKLEVFHLSDMFFDHQLIVPNFQVNSIIKFHAKQGTVLYVIKISIKPSISIKPKGIHSQLLVKIRSIPLIKILTIIKIQQDQRISDFIGISKVKIRLSLCKRSKVLIIIQLKLHLLGQEWRNILLFQL